MKKHDLQPTPDNIRNTFIRDSIGRNKDLVNFIKIIDSIDESFSIALDSYWGSGKTFFVKQVKMILDTVTEESYGEVEGKNQILSTWRTLSNQMQLKKHVPIYYDAWANDCDDDPIYSLVYQMILDTEKNKGIKDKISFSDVLSVAGKITEAIAGFDPNDIADAFKKGDFLETLRERKDIGKLIEKYIDKLLPEGCDRLLIIIDELDRCNPEFAVKLLERIKHYFNNDKVTFVFSVNLAELQITIRKYYGEEFNASRYLDRFFDLRVVLPPPDMKKFYSLINFSQNDPTFGSLSSVMELVFNKEHMQMRECIKLVSLMRTINFEEIRRYACYEQERGYSEIIIYKIIIPVVWGSMINNVFLFNRFMRERDCSILTYFYNDKTTIDTVDHTLYSLYTEEEINSKRPDYSTKSDIDLLHKKLSDFYNALINADNEVKVGKCLITDRERDIFHRTVSLLANNTLLKENNDN